jgi:acyl-CoA reductase-like NAD-dependent aldehyde dehydrogenase
MTAPDLRPFIAGRHVESHGDDVMTSVNPATEQVLWQLPVGDPHDIDDAVRAARDAFDHSVWRHDATLRRECLLRLADAIDERTHDLALLDTLEIGIPLSVTTDDAAAAASFVRDIVAMAPDVGADVSAPVQRIPRGVVGVIAPWNFPFFVALTKAVPALAVGNTVVLKPSELGSASALMLASLAHAAGLPAGVFNVVPGRGDTVGEALVRHRLVDQINLTSSLSTGRRVLHASAETGLTPVLTELGGKSAHVVGEHAPDLVTVADAVAANIFWCAGQVCSSGSRLIVAERHHDRLVALLIDRVEAWIGRDPMDPATHAGPLGSESHHAAVHRMVRTAADEGAVVRTGGVPGPRPGWYYPPTILTGVEPHHQVFHDEVFGPVLAVTACRSAAHGIELANATDYGLVATGWSTDRTEIEQLAQGLRAAWVTVNPHLDPPSDPRAGAESIGASGSGVEGGLPGMRAATRIAVVSVGGASMTSTTQEDAP